LPIAAVAHFLLDSYVGLITYGSSVNVYELGFSHFPKIHCFDAKKCVSFSFACDYRYGSRSFAFLL